MLEYLHVRNLALMDEVRLDFTNGFIAVTGETGAGKSVLLGALSLLSGSRADKSLVRQGEDTCEVEAVLAFPNTAKVNATLSRLGLPACEDGQLILRRSIPRNKSNRIQINGELTTLARLQELGEEWIDFHGPGEPQKLFSESWQLTLLDRFARHETLLSAYSQTYESWKRVKAQHKDLISKQALTPDEQAFLRSQIEEIDLLKLSPERIQKLDNDYKRLSGAQELLELTNSLNEILADDHGIADLLGNAILQGKKISTLDPQATQLSDRLESLAIEVEDLSAEYQALVEEFEFDETTTAKIEAEMESWLSIKRKYGGSIESIIERRNAMKARLETQGDLKGSIQELEKEIKAKEQTLTESGEKLRESRVKAAHQLSKLVADCLQTLGFKKPQLQIEILRENGFHAHGTSACRFQFSPNPGQDLLPLNKIASSGELARVMLALKTILAKVDETPVLVFDEVDANIGGEIASAVASQLAHLGRTHQVFCITHLPQVAAVANSHYLVSKEQTNEQTSVSINVLNANSKGRIEEIARMLGDRTSASGLKHAEALLKPLTVATK